MHISTNLDDNYSQKLDYLTKATHKDVSEVIEQAIDRYYEYMKQTQANASEILQQSGFIGCIEAEPTLSESYKARLAEILEKKYDDR